MRKAGLLQETQRHRMLETSGIDALQGVNLISVDIQPEYQDYLTFDLEEYLGIINANGWRYQPMPERSGNRTHGTR